MILNVVTILHLARLWFCIFKEDSSGGGHRRAYSSQILRERLPQLSQYLSKSTKINTNIETAMLFSSHNKCFQTLKSHIGVPKTSLQSIFQRESLGTWSNLKGRKSQKLRLRLKLMSVKLADSTILSPISQIIECLRRWFTITDWAKVNLPLHSG